MLCTAWPSGTVYEVCLAAPSTSTVGPAGKVIQAPATIGLRS